MNLYSFCPLSTYDYACNFSITTLIAKIVVVPDAFKIVVQIPLLPSLANRELLYYFWLIHSTLGAMCVLYIVSHVLVRAVFCTYYTHNLTFQLRPCHYPFRCACRDLTYFVSSLYLSGVNNSCGNGGEICLVKYASLRVRPLLHILSACAFAFITRVMCLAKKNTSLNVT